MAQGRGPGGHFSRGFMTEEEKANQPKVTSALLKRVFSYLTPYRGRLALVLVCIAAASFFTLLPSILTGKIIDEGLVKRDFGALVKYIVLSLAVTLGANLIGVAESYINTWIAQHITYDMRNQMYAHLQKMSQRFFTTNNQGDVITRMTSDIDGVQQVITSTFTSILSNVITLIIAMVAMFRKNWVLALIGMVIGGGFMLLCAVAGKLIFGQEAFGFGDVKLCAALGLVLGINGTIATLAAAVIISGFVAAGGLASGKYRKGDRKPFGPYLCGCAMAYILIALPLVQSFNAAV